MKRFLCVASVFALAVAVGYAADVPAPAKPAVPTKIDFDPSKITISVKDAKLADVLKMLADQSGDSLLALPDKWQDKPVTLDVKGLPYFEALDALCKVAGLTYTIKDQALSLCPAEGAVDVGAYLGPATAKAEQLTKSRVFRGVMQPDPSGLTLQLDVFWEDRLATVGDEFIVTRVSTSDGRDLKIRQMKQRVLTLGGGGMGMFGPAGTAPKPSARQTFARLSELPDKLGRTIVAEGTFRLTLGSGEKILTIPKVLEAGDRTAIEGDLSLKVTQFQKAGGAWGVVNAPQPAGPQANSIFAQIQVTKIGQEIVAVGLPGSPYGFFLVDAKGTRYPASQLWGTQQEKEGAWLAGCQVWFTKLPEMDADWSLIYVYPEKQESKEWPFKLENVPLP